MYQENAQLNPPSGIPLMERLAGILCRYYRDNRPAILAALVVGLLTYTYAFTNKLLNLDELAFLYSKGADIESGRWVLPLMSFIFPDFSMPRIYGVISLAIMAVSICVLIRELRIENTLLQVLFSGLVVAAPPLIATVTYMFTLSAYVVGFLMSVLAVACVNRKGAASRILGVVFSVLSIGVYQPFIAVTSSFMLVCLIRELIQKDAEAKDIVRKGLRDLACLGIACAGYFVINTVVQRLTGIDFGQYAHRQLDISGLLSPEKFKRVYTVYISELLYGAFGFMSTPTARGCHALCMGISALCVLRWMSGCKDAVKIILMILLLLLLPVSISCLVLVVEAAAIQTLLFFSFAAVYGLFCVLLEAGVHLHRNQKMRNLVYNVVTAAMAVILVCNIYVGNCTFLRMHLAQVNAHSFFTSVATRIQADELFSRDCKVALIGRADQYIYALEEFDTPQVPNIRAAEGINVNAWSRPSFITRYVGFDIEHATDAEMAMIVKDPAFKQMNVYPYEGSIGRFGDIMVVKFSNPEEMPEDE